MIVGLNSGPNGGFWVSEFVLRDRLVGFDVALLCAGGCARGCRGGGKWGGGRGRGNVGVDARFAAAAYHGRIGYCCRS